MSHGTMLTMTTDFIPAPATPPGQRFGHPPVVPPRQTSICDGSENRTPLRTPHAHIYHFPQKQHLYGPTAHRNSLYVNSPSPPSPYQPLPTHPAFRTRKASHVPIVISQDVIDRALAHKPLSPTPKGQGRLLRSFATFSRRSPRKGSSSSEALPVPHRKPRHTPIVIPDLAQPSNATRRSSLTPPLSASDTLFGARSQLTVDLSPLTPTGSDCETPKASVIYVKGPPTPPLTMSRPATGNSMANGGNELHNNLYGSFGEAVDLSTSQHSFASDASQDDQITPNESSHSKAKPYTSTPQSTKTVTPLASDPKTPTVPSSNLSGLVCNVHRCTGREPAGLVGATTTILGDKLYVFGGRSLSRRRPHMTADLYELDLIHRHWSKIRTKGQVPSPRYFHSVCGLGDTKLICYGGMSPAPANPSVQQTQNADQPDVVVMSDLHVYDTKTRTWTRIDTQDTPQGRYAHCAAVLPSTAVFASANAPLSAIHHNPSESDNPNSGQLGVALDGTGGAEMIVVGGQDNANHYIEQISIFNLRSLKWTSTNSLGRSCGAYRSVVAPLTGFPASKIGSGIEAAKAVEKEARTAPDANSMLIYSNFNFLDVKLELQVRTQDGKLEEKPMAGPFSPPGLRFPNGGILNNHFVISGTYLTSSRQEYALWALDLRTMTWSRIDVGGSVFGQGSWNRGVLWPRRNTFVILGNRKRTLVEDYNHRRINFTNICLVELEAFGLYDNPRHIAPTSGYTSYSAPELPPSLRPKASQWSGGGRPHFAAAEELGKLALGMKELADMDILTISGERIPANSHMLARRWGAYFVQILREGSTNGQAGIGGRGAFDNMTLNLSEDTDGGSTLRPLPAGYRNSSVTITPSIATAYTSATTLTAGSGHSVGGSTLASQASSHTASASVTSTGTMLTNGTSMSATTVTGGSASDDATKPFHAPSPASLPASTRSRTLYLPHTAPTVQALLHFIYTSALPPPATHPNLSSPQVLCSLLQLARPYRVDGLLEAVLQRLHDVMDGRSAAAVFNACAMAAGGGRGTGFEKVGAGTVLVSENELDEARGIAGRSLSQANVGNGSGLGGGGAAAAVVTERPRMGSRVRTAGERKNTFDAGNGTMALSSNISAASAASGTESTDVSEDESGSGTDTDGASLTDGSDVWDDGIGGAGGAEREVWTGERSCVIGLQKRGLRGLMEGRKLRERGESVTAAAAATTTTTVATLGKRA